MAAVEIFHGHYVNCDLRRECLHQRVVRNTIFRKAPSAVVSGYGKRSINLNKVVATLITYKTKSN
jgi:hypothetical protein